LDLQSLDKSIREGGDEKRVEKFFKIRRNIEEVR